MYEILKRAGEHPANQDPLRQFAIIQAKGLLVDAGVKDPGLAAIQNGLKPIETIPILPKGARVFDIAISSENMSELEQLKSTGTLHVGTWARDIIQLAPASSEKPQTLRLAALSARTMGLRDDYPTTTKVWERAKKFGGNVTVKDMIQVAIEAAKGNIQVEIGKPLVGIMDPITDSYGSLRALYVGRSEDGLWLRASYAIPDSQWSPDDQFVVSPSK